MKYTNPAARLHRSAVALCVLFGAAGAPAHAAHPGELDPSFGNGSGYLTKDFFATDEQIFALAPLRDGRLVAAGVVSAANASGPGGSLNAAVARFLPNGALDDGFGSGGLFHLDIDGGTDEAHAVKLLSDRSLLIGATLSTDAHADFGVVKLRANGQLDTSFGEPDAGSLRKGYVRLDIGGSNIHDEVAALATQSDGRIIAAGITRVLHQSGFLYSQLAIARFSVDGVLDTSFGAGAGYVVLPPFVGEAGDILTGIALDQAGSLGGDNRIVLVGYTFARSTAFIARLNADGSADASFGNGSGRISIQPGSSAGQSTGLSMIAGARLTRGGDIVVAGEGNDRGLTAMRFHADGALDSSFGSNGRTLVKFSGGSEYDEPAAITLQGNGKIVLSGYATSHATGAPRRDFYVARLLADGTIDGDFGSDAAHPGQVMVQIASDDDGALAAAVEPSGNLLIGGYAADGNRDFALLRLFGDPDRLFMDGFDGPGFQ